MLSVPALLLQFLQPPPFVPPQPPPPTNAQLIQNLQHLVGPRSGAPVGQRTVQLTPGDLLLGRMNVQVRTETRGEQLQLTVSTSDGVMR